jgi:hypothetical protein
MSKLWKRLILIGCLLSMVVQQTAHAQAALAPVENYVINRAIGGILANRIMVARGIAANDATWLATAANDPVYKATMAGVSSTLTKANVASTALGVGLAIAGAPVWLTVAASLGVIGVGMWIAGDLSTQTELAIRPSSTGDGSNVIQVVNKPMTLPEYPGGTPSGIGYGVDLALSKGANIYRNPTSCVQGYPCYQLPSLPASVPMKYISGDVVLVASTVDELSRYYVNMITPKLCNAECGFVGTTFTMESYGGGFNYTDDGSPKWYVTVHESRSGGDSYGLPSYDRQYVVYPTGGFFTPGSYPSVYKDLDSAYQNMGSDLKATKISDSIIASLVDAAWRRAAADPDYAGLPYSASNPVTVTEVSTWKAVNPSGAPTLDDLLRPAQNTSTDSSGVPISPLVQPLTNPGANPSANPGTGTSSNPGTNTGLGTNVNVINSPRVDLGPDPGTADPTLEQTPDASTILSPLTSLFPELRNFQTPIHGSDCPKPEFDVFGQSIVMTSHCEIADMHRWEFNAVMLAVWMLVGLFIVLSA